MKAQNGAKPRVKQEESGPAHKSVGLASWLRTIGKLEVNVTSEWLAWVQGWRKVERVR